jgi:hypothetical protein
MRIVSRRPHAPGAALPSMRSGLVVALAAVCVLWAAAPIRAAEVSDEQAQQLEQRMRDWLAALTGPSVDLGERPVQFVAEDDHYALTIPLAGVFGRSGITLESAPMTGTAKPLDGGRWAIDDIRAPSPLKLTFPSPDGHGTIISTIAVTEQDQHAVLDPSLATSSTWDATIRGYTSTTEGPTGAGHSSIDRIVSHIAWEPAGNGRMNALLDSDYHLIAINSTMPATAGAPNIGPVSFTAERGLTTMHANGVMPERITQLLHAAIQLSPMAVAEMQAVAQEAETSRADARPSQGKRADAKPGDGKRKPAAKPATAPAAAPPATHVTVTAQDRATLREAVVALQDLSSGFDEQATLQDVHVAGGGHGGHADKLSLGMAVDAPEGLLRLRYNIGLDGLDSPEIPAGVLRNFLPRHIALTPRLSGLPATDVIALLLRAIDSNGDDPDLEVQAKALLGKGPVAYGLDELALDVGAATLTGSGEMQGTGSNGYTGHAHLAATGLDALIRSANTTPELKQAAPALIFLKGIGQQDGKSVVWDIAYQDGKVLVNGTDMSQMMPGK